MFGPPTAGSWWTRPYADIVETAGERGSVVVLPVGSIEQHGRHLPVATDTILVESVASAALERLDDCPVLMTPPVWAGYSPHHLGFGGTLSLDFETLMAVLEQVARTALENGFDALLLLNGHGGNVPLNDGATSTIGTDHPDVEVLGLTYFSLAAPFVDDIRESDHGGMAHGGEFETSLMLHYRPDLVDEDRLEGDLVDEPYDRGFDDLFAGGSLTTYREFDDVYSSGAVGAPELSSAEKGRALAEGLADELADLIRTVHERNRS